MILPQLLREIEDRGVTLMAAPVEPRLRFRPASALTSELVEELREHKAAVLQVLEVREALAADPNPERVESVVDVFEMARPYLDPDQEDPPIPPPARGRDPLVHRHTAKARFFRVVDGGAA